ncbi:MAG: acyl-ACP--UDP-N-acetylglucosamine O-acyltransferase [Chlamydiota bacterium]
MVKQDIHPHAYVESGAKIGANVHIEPFAVVKKHVVLKDGVTVKSHAYLDGHTTVGENTTIWPGASVGTKTQNLKYQGEKTHVFIGKNCDIREYVTINSSCGEDSEVVIGDGCLIMAYCHIAHNCRLGNSVIMTNNAMLAGYVTIGDSAIIGGMTPVHQYSRIGRYAMVGGFSRVGSDIPPFTVGGGAPYKFGGINIIGLQRNGFSLYARQCLAQAFKLTYRSNLPLKEALDAICSTIEPIEEIVHWVEFCRTSKRGLLGLQGICRQDPEELSEEEMKELFEQEQEQQV